MCMFRVHASTSNYRLAELAYPTLYPRPALRQPPIRQSSAERASYNGDYCENLRLSVLLNRMYLGGMAKAPSPESLPQSADEGLRLRRATKQCHNARGFTGSRQYGLQHAHGGSAEASAGVSGPRRRRGGAVVLLREALPVPDMRHFAKPRRPPPAKAIDLDAPSAGHVPQVELRLRRLPDGLTRLSAPPLNE